MISIHHDNSDNLDYTFSLVLVTKIRDVNSTWPLCDKGECPAAASRVDISSAIVNRFNT